MREIEGVRGALPAYEVFDGWEPSSRDDLLTAHTVLKAGLVNQPGTFHDKATGQ
jgi:hypothetical protein